MKKLQPIYALFITLFLLYAFSGNPPNGRTGAPGDGKCTDCHTPNNSGFDGSVAIQGLPATIQPNTTYNLSVVTSITAGSPVRTGFQMVLLDDDNIDVGTLDNSDNNSAIANANGRSYFEHSPAQPFNGADSIVWRVDWTSPATLTTDSIRVYLNSMIANGSGSSGDLMVSNKSAFFFEGASAEPLIVQVISSNDVSCFGDSDGSASVSTSGGTGDITFNWSNNSITNSISNLSTGRYIVTATDTEGMTATATITIEQPQLLTVAIDSITNIDCTNAIGNATANATGGTAPYTYNWSSGDNGEMVNLTEGTYTVIVLDANQCSDTTEVIIAADISDPVAFAGLDVTVTCADTNTTSVQLDAFNSSTGTGVAYLWTSTDGNIVSGETTLIPIVDAAGSYILIVSNATNTCMASDTTVVVFNTTLPTANAGATQQLDCNNITVILDGSASSQSADLVYSWTTIDGNIMSGATTLMPTVSNAGTYFLAVNNSATSCSAIDSVVVTKDDDLPTANAGMDTSLDCNNDTLILIGSGSMGDNITYLWTTSDGLILGSDTTLGLTIIGAGTYTLLVMDAINNCSATSSITISNEVLPIANAGRAGVLGCDNPILVLGGSASSAGDNITYVWTTTDGNIIEGANTTMPAIDAAGTYTLKVTNITTGCTSSASVEITAMLATDLFAASGDAAQLTCAESSLTLNAFATQGENIVYIWTTESGNIVSGANTLMPVIDAAGKYILFVRDRISGCEAISSVTIVEDIELPTVSAGDSLTLDCNVTSVTLSGSSTTQFNLTYNWTTSDGNIISGANTPNSVVNTSGNYILTVLDTFTNCSASASVSVGQDADVPMANAGMTMQLDCNTDSLTLGGSGSTGNNFTTNWTTDNGNILTGASTYTPMIDTAGIYILTVTDTTSGCSSTTRVEVIKNIEKPIVEAGADEQFLCGDGTLAIAGTASIGDDFIYFWCTETGNVLSGAEDISVVISGAGLFEFIVTNTANGCKNVDSVVVTEVEGIELALDTITAGSATVSVSGGTAPYAYSWNTDSMDTGSTITGLLAGDYQITATDANGCMDTLLVTIELSTRTLELEQSIEFLQVFPNPTSAYFEIGIDFNQILKGEIVIMNNVGQLMWQRNFDANNLDYKVEVNDWVSGVYFMVIQTAFGIRTEQIVVMK